MLKYYMVSWTEHHESCSVYNSKRFFERDRALRFAIKMKGTVRLHTVKIASETRRSLDFHELPSYCFDEQGQPLI